MPDSTPQPLLESHPKPTPSNVPAERVWVEVSKLAADGPRRLSAIAAGLEPVQAEPGKLVLRAARISPVLAEPVLGDLEKLAMRVSGAAVSIELVDNGGVPESAREHSSSDTETARDAGLGSPEPTRPDHAPGRQAHAEPSGRAEDHPLVRTTLDAFGGEIVDIRSKHR
ncbi:MAG: hypothetical protein AAGG07_09400 [Planctomycetota bacterium]